MGFDFSSLVDKFSTDFVVITKGEGIYNDVGEIEYGADSEVAGTGAIMDMSQRTIYNSNGVITSKDKQLYTLILIAEKSRIKHLESSYYVEPDRGNSNAIFTGVYSYILKWVSAFD